MAAIWSKPGELRHVVNIEAPSSPPSGTQSPSGAWSNQPWTIFAQGLRARIEPTGGSERSGAGAMIAQATHTVNLRYYPGIMAKMRVHFQGRFFDILNVNNIDERNRELELSCREGRSHGNK
jgi:SPP1 family predicted phage head-tail adaptor